MKNFIAPNLLKIYMIHLDFEGFGQFWPFLAFFGLPKSKMWPNWVISSRSGRFSTSILDDLSSSKVRKNLNLCIGIKIERFRGHLGGSTVVSPNPLFFSFLALKRLQMLFLAPKLCMRLKIVIPDPTRFIKIFTFWDFFLVKFQKMC